MDFKDFIWDIKDDLSILDEMDRFRLFLAGMKNPQRAEVIESEETDLYSGRIPHKANQRTIELLSLMEEFGFVTSFQLDGSGARVYSLVPSEKFKLSYQKRAKQILEAKSEIDGSRVSNQFDDLLDHIDRKFADLMVEENLNATDLANMIEELKEEFRQFSKPSITRLVRMKVSEYFTEETVKQAAVLPMLEEVSDIISNLP